MIALVENITETPYAYQVTVFCNKINPSRVTLTVARDVYQQLHKQGIDGDNEVGITVTVLNPSDS